jgi:hypothetical protein
MTGCLYLSREIMVTRRLIALTCALLPIGACSRHEEIGLDATTGRQRIYVLSDVEADAIAHGAIVSSFPGRKIEAINGPVRGYSTYIRVIIDTFSQQVLIKPVTGRRADGAAIDGYGFEVSGSGTAGIQGNLQNAHFGRTLQASLDATGKAVEVVSVAPRALPSSQSARSDEGSDTARQLRSLRDLFDQGLISAVEYDNKRREILGRL